MTYKTPFKITPLILKISQDISRALGKIAGQKISEAPLKLRRSNNIKTIQASLAIEGNTLTLDQVTNLLEGKRVIGPAKDILEVKNALIVYSNLKGFDPLKIDHLLKAHQVLMNELIDENGKWRSKAVGIFKGKEVSHIAPQSHRVPILIEDLFGFLKNEMNLSWLIKACIFHYEFEFIHPFADGNGRIGRLWQQLILMKEDPIFEYLPLEVLIKNNQDRYYKTLEESDNLAESAPFIEFSLEIIHAALEEYVTTTNPFPQTPLLRLNYAKIHIKKEEFSRKDYLNLHKDISSATASRDLLTGIAQGILKRKGAKNQAIYCFH